MRSLIQTLAIFLLPILGFAVYMLYAKRRARLRGADAPKWEDGPWFWLVASGLVLAIAGFVIFGMLEEASEGFKSLPPRPGP